MRKAVALVPLVAVLMAACGPGEQPAEPVENAAGAGFPEVDVWLSITDSIGLEVGDSNLVFGMPAVAAWMPGDRIAVMDMQKCRVSIFSRDGGFITSVGRQGSGPGEFLLPSWLSVTPRGGLMISDAMAGELDFFDSTLTYSGSVGGFFPSPPIITVSLSDTVFVGMKPDFEQNEQGMFMGYTVARWNTADPAPELTYHRDLAPLQDPTDMSAMTDNMVLFAASPGGQVYTTVFSTEKYEFSAWNPDGTPLFTVSEPFERVEKSPEDIDIERQFVRDRMRQGGAPDFMVESYEPDPYRYAIGSLGIAPDGTLWVGMGVYNHPVFRVYDAATGDYLYTAALENPDNPRDLTVGMNRWGFTALDQMSGDWPRVYLLDISE
jgi:hypothetical protein